MGFRDWVKKMKSSSSSEYVKTYPDPVIFRRLYKYINPYRRDLKLLIFLMIITQVTQLAYPLGMTLILQVVRGTNIEQLTGISFIDKYFAQIGIVSRYDLLIIVGVSLMIIMFINFLAKRAYQYNINKLSQYVMNDVRRDVFHKFQDLSMDYFTNNPAGSLMSRITNDVGAIQMLVTTAIVQSIGDIFSVVTTFGIMMYFSWQLTLFILLFVPLFGFVFYVFALKSRYYWVKQRKTIQEITRILQEAVSGSKTIKAFVTEDQNIETFNAANKADKEINLAAARLNAFLQPITQVIIACGIGMVIYMGAYLVRNDLLAIELMLGYVVLALNFINPFNNLGNIYNQSQQALAAGDRVLNLLDTQPSVIDKLNTKELPPIQGIIEYRNVHFEYVKDLPVLKNINFKTQKNQRYAFVGFTGAGKTTLISLLSRFYDPTQGQVLIDGIDLKEVSLKSIRSQMGIVLQDTYLFSGTVMDNIRYGKLGASDEEVIEAAKKVGAHKFIMNLPQEYKTDVRERGSLLSVGQRQLISFARALLANPPVLILDEATSSVDPYTEIKIQEALEVLLTNRNSFIIAHRLSTILNSDIICVMENGQIIQRGNHEELMAQGGLYKHLYEMQFKKMEEKEKDTLSKQS